MTVRFMMRPWRRILMVALIASAFAAGPITERAQAGKLNELDTSLKLVPADAAFYSASLRMGEQIDAIRGSRAWAKLTLMPVLQMGGMFYNMQAANPQSVPGQLKAAWENPETRKSIDLLLDMGSQEIFCYGDKDLGDTVRLLQQIVGAMRYVPLMMQLSDQAGELSGEDQQTRLMLSVILENLELLKIPTMVMGFKLSDTDRATEQLAVLEQLVTPLFEMEPMLKGRLKRTKIDGHEYLTISLDGSMVPWDEVPTDKLKEIETTEGDAERLIARVKEMTLVVALGVRDDYLLVSVGNSTDCLANLGKGPTLADRPELKPLEKFADERLISIAYLSEDIARQLSSTKEDIDGLVEFAKQALPTVDELNDDQKQRILKDIGVLAEDIKSAVPEPGPIMGFSFLTEQGIEGYQYNWAEHARLDGSKPLSILQHLGGDPLIAIVGRGVQSPGDYDLLVKWVNVGYGYFKEFGLPEMSKKDRKQYDQVVELFMPLVKQLDKANRDLLIPAFADGQVALVVDRKLTSKQFVKGMPATDEPMPMLEPAIVLGVSDAKLASRACQEYRAVANGVIDAIREIEPDGIPDDFRIPDPKVAESELGTISGYDLPGEWGVDKKIMPNWGLGETVAVMSISRRHTKRLLKATPLKVGGVLTDLDRPRAGAMVFNWAGLIEMAKPWIDLGIEQINEQSDGDDFAVGFAANAIGSQVHTVLDVLQVFRTVTAEIYIEDGAVVQHSLIEIRDLEP